MTLKTLLKISRPRFWIYLLGPYLVGLAAAWQVPDWKIILLGIYLTLPANLLIYGVNDIYDQDTDKLNSKKDGYEARLQSGYVKKLGLIIALSNIPFLAVFLWLPLDAWYWLGLFLITGIGYSAAPIRAKTKPGLDAAFNILYAAPGFAAYVALSGQQPAWEIVIASLAWCIAMHAYSAVPDIKADKDSDTPTIATTLGSARTLLFCLICYVLSAVLSYKYLDWFAVVAGVIYASLILASLIKRSSETSLFKLYTLFPYVNTVLGAGLFFVVAAQR